MRLSQLSTSLSNIARKTVCRVLHAETLLARELYRANTAFTIVDPATVEGRNAIDWRRFGFGNYDAPIVGVPRNQLSKLAFIDKDLLRRYLAREEVFVAPSRHDPFTMTDYVNDWSDRFQRTGVAVILPRYIVSFFREQNFGNFVLAGPVQELVIKRKLDTELFNAFADAQQNGRPTIVYHIRHIDFLPAFLRIFTIRIGPQ